MSPEDERLARPDERDLAWDAVLTDLEAALASGTSAPWAPPTDLGPIPRTQVGRASRLVAAQRDVIAGLEAERTTVAQHLSALRAVGDSREPSRSVYLDVTG